MIYWIITMHTKIFVKFLNETVIPAGSYWYQNTYVSWYRSLPVTTGISWLTGHCSHWFLTWCSCAGIHSTRITEWIPALWTRAVGTVVARHSDHTATESNYTNHDNDNDYDNNNDLIIIMIMTQEKDFMLMSVANRRLI